MSLEPFEAISVVIPTYNERENVGPLLDEFSSLNQTGFRVLEIVIVDDASPDGTGPAATSHGRSLGLPVRVISRRGPRSMGKAIAEGIDASRGEVICVMDADLSHPPSLLRQLVETMDGADGVVASRYADGGRIHAWPLRRRLISSVATSMAKVLFDPPCRDPISGFFMFRRSVLSDIRITGIGNKPLLEILAQKSLIIHELPYEFRDRRYGTSKLNRDGITDFVRLLAVLVRTSVERGTKGLLDETSGTPAPRQP